MADAKPATPGGAGTGASTPAGYQVRRHVDAAVIADIAGWLLRGRGRRPVASFISSLKR